MINSELDIDYSDLHWGKYDNPMAQYIAVQVIGNGERGDDEWSNPDWGEGWMRFGRRLFSWTSQGFEYCDTFATVADAERDREQWWENAHADWDETCQKCGIRLPFDDEDAYSDHESDGCGLSGDEANEWIAQYFATDAEHFTNGTGVAWIFYKVYPEVAKVDAIMVGDGLVQYEDLASFRPLSDSEYCGGCGQIGCTAYDNGESE